MRDKGIILAGLAVFLGLITFPVWYNMAAGPKAKWQEPVLPKTEKNCVMPKEYMRQKHMELLITWRDEVVRQNVRTFKAFDGRVYNMSLTNTCMKCHDNKKEFCDRCHNYAGVTPYCWDCHIDPALTQRSEG